MLKQLGTGAPVCINVTIVDRIVAARFAEKLSALRIYLRASNPGRSTDVHFPSERELEATTVLHSVEEASVKTRTGPPIDDAED